MNKASIDNHDIFYYESDDPVVDHLKKGYLYGKNNYQIGMIYLQDTDGYIIDCGAHIGTFGLTPATENKPILMIEAAPKNIECLNETFKNLPSAIVEHQVILDTVKQCDFSHDSGPFGFVQENNSGSRTSTTIDHLCSKHNIQKVCFIKYDIEGYEIEALLGSENTLQQNKPLLILEVNGHCLRIRNKKPYDIIDTLENLGYLSFIRNQHNALIRVNKNDKFPFCVMDIICIHEDKIANYLGNFIFGPYLDQNTIEQIIQQNIPRANNECQEYFKTITN